MTVLTGTDVDLALRTIWGEARGEGFQGMVAVGDVLLNRLKDGRWGTTLVAVCLWPWQFGCWNYTDPNRLRMLNMSPTSLDLQDPGKAFSAARSQESIGRSVTQGATHYYADTIKAPTWVQGATPTVHIGHHLFYRDVN